MRDLPKLRLEMIFVLIAADARAVSTNRAT